jgi:hypothetical protein
MLIIDNSFNMYVLVSILNGFRHVFHEITRSGIYADINSWLLESRDDFGPYQLIQGDVDRYETVIPIGTGKKSHAFLGKLDGTHLGTIKILKPMPFFKRQKEIAVLEKLKAVPTVTVCPDVTEYQQFSRQKDLYPSVA